MQNMSQSSSQRDKMYSQGASPSGGGAAPPRGRTSRPLARACSPQHCIRPPANGGGHHPKGGGPLCVPGAFFDRALRGGSSRAYSSKTATEEPSAKLQRPPLLPPEAGGARSAPQASPRGAELEASPPEGGSPKGDARANAPKQYCCILIFSVRSNGTNANKIFVNVTNFKGQTIIKFSSGLIQKSGSKKQIKSNAVAK